MIILANPRSDWNVLRPLLFESSSSADSSA